jgi:hypothetical protein
MCEADRRAPYAVPLELHETKAGILVMVFSLLLWKVMEKWNGEHRSTYCFNYPIGRTIHDANARVGNHRRALHFAASPDGAHLLVENYGSHILAVLPAFHVWDPVKKGMLGSRCWLSSGCTPVACLTCDGLELEVLHDPAYWHDLKKPGSFPGGLDLTQLSTSNAVWHQYAERSLQ